MASWTTSLFGGKSQVKGGQGGVTGGDSSKEITTEDAKDDLYSSGNLGAAAKTVTYEGAPINYNIGRTIGGAPGTIKLDKVLQQPHYLETDIKSGRDAWSRAFYNTGAAYGSCLILGSMYGGLVGLRNAPSKRFKIRLNSVLNEASNRGARISNSAGVVALMYSLTKAGIEYTTVTDRMGLGDWADSVLAAGITGMVYKFPRGPQHMALFATAGAAVMGSSVILSKQLAQRGIRVSLASMLARH